LLNDVAGISAEIEDNILVINATDQPFTISAPDDESQYLMDALGLHPIVEDAS